METSLAKWLIINSVRLIFGFVFFFIQNQLKKYLTKKILRLFIRCRLFFISHFACEFMRRQRIINKITNHLTLSWCDQIWEKNIRFDATNEHRWDCVHWEKCSKEGKKAEQRQSSPVESKSERNWLRISELIGLFMLWVVGWAAGSCSAFYHCNTRNK